MTLGELDLPFICQMGMRQRGRLLQVLARESQSWRSCSETFSKYHADEGDMGVHSFK